MSTTDVARARLQERLEKEGGIRGRESAVMLAKAVVGLVSTLYSVFVGYTLIARYGQYTSGTAWFLAIAFRSLFESMSAWWASDKSVAFTAAVALQLSPFLRWHMLRGPVAAADVRKVSFRCHTVFGDLWALVQSLPQLFVSVYQTVLLTLIIHEGDAENTGGRDEPTGGKFALFAVSTVFSAVTAVLAMRAFETGVIHDGANEAEVRGSDDHNDEEGRRLLRAMGLSGLLPSALTMSWRALSLTAHVFGYACYVVGSVSGTRGSSATVAFFGYVGLASVVTMLMYDGPAAGKDRRELRPSRYGKCGGGIPCSDRSPNLFMLAVMNLVAPTEDFGAFFPMANSPFRMALVVVYEAVSFGGIYFGYLYADFRDHDRLSSARSTEHKLFRIIELYFLLDLALLLAWLVMQRRSAWPLSACFGGRGGRAGVAEPLIRAGGSGSAAAV